MGMREQVGRGVLWSSIGWIGSYALNLAFTIVTARLLAPEVFGVVALASIVVVAGNVVTSSGTRAAIVHLEDRVEDAVSTALISLPMAGVATGLIAAGLAPLIASFYNEPDVGPVVVALSGIMLVRCLGIVPDALLQRDFRFKARQGLVEPLSVLAYGVAVCILAPLGAEEWSLVVGQYAAQVTIVIGSWWLAKPWRRLGHPSYRMWRRLASYGRHLLTANLVELVDAQADRIALGRNVSVQSVGFYSAGLRLATLPVTGVVNVVGQATFPALTRMRDDAERFTRAVLETVSGLALLSTLFCISLSGLAEPLVVTMFGEVWRPAGDVLQVLAFWSLALALTEATREVFKAAGRPWWVARIAFLAAISLVALLAAAWAFGVVGLIVVSACRVVAGVIGLGMGAVALTGSMRAGLRELWRAVRPSVLAGAALGAYYLVVDLTPLGGYEDWVPSLGPLVPLAMLAAVFLVGVAVYGAVVELVAPGTRAAVLRPLRSLVAGRRRGAADES